MLQWQAPTILNPHLSSGTKDDLVCAVVYESLIRIDNDGNFIPFLAESIPSLDNGLLAADAESGQLEAEAGPKVERRHPADRRRLCHHLGVRHRSQDGGDDPIAFSRMSPRSRRPMT